MDLLDISRNPHKLPSFIYQKYGPPVGFWESLRRGGTGSPGLWLRSAGPVLNDHIQSGIHSVKEPVKAQFQLLQRSLIVRILVRPAVHVAIFAGDELEAIHLYKQSKSLEEEQNPSGIRLPSYYGKVALHFTGDFLTWEFKTGAIRATQRYFARSFLAERFFYHKR